METERIQNLIRKFPLLLPTVAKLNSADIPWMIAGSGALYVNGNPRMPKDIDFFLPAREHDSADALFGIESFIYTSPLEHVRNSNPNSDHSMQLTSSLVIRKGDSEYHLEPTDTVLFWRDTFVVDKEKFYCVAPEEALLIKAILARGADVGKNDIADIHSFLTINPDINLEYLRIREKELGLPPNFWRQATE